MLVRQKTIKALIQRTLRRSHVKAFTIFCVVVYDAGIDRVFLGTEIEYVCLFLGEKKASVRAFDNANMDLETLRYIEKMI